jgi:hypothetical protein
VRNCASLVIPTPGLSGSQIFHDVISVTKSNTWDVSPLVPDVNCDIDFTNDVVMTISPTPPSQTPTLIIYSGGNVYS